MFIYTLLTNFQNYEYISVVLKFINAVLKIKENSYNKLIIKTNYGINQNIGIHIYLYSNQYKKVQEEFEQNRN